MTVRKGVSFSYEECEKYYKTFDERMLTLGNQRRAYKYFQSRNRDLFEAAGAGVKEKVRKAVESGISINEMDPYGNTAFSLLLQHMTYYNDDHDITYEDEIFLNYLFDRGANVNLFGVDECADPPLFQAFIDHADRLFKWLSDRGADPNAEVCNDDYCDKDYSVTIQDWIDDEGKDI